MPTGNQQSDDTTAIAGATPAVGGTTPVDEKDDNRRRRPTSYDYLSEIYDYESIVRIYQERLDKLGDGLGALGKKLGMHGGVTLSPSTYTLVVPGGASRQVWDPVPQHISPEDFRVIDRLYAAFQGSDIRVAARAQFFRKLNSVTQTLVRGHAFAALARQELGTATPEDGTRISALDPKLLTRFHEWRSKVPDPEAWLRDAAAHTDERVFQALKYMFTVDYPEFGRALTIEQLEKAFAVWPRKGGPRPSNKHKRKWEALADIMNEIGLGPIKATSLQQEFKDLGA
jgi:hypothetical protein